MPVGRPQKLAVLTADYTALVGLSQSTSGRVRPRHRLLIDSTSKPGPLETESDWAKTRVTK